MSLKRRMITTMEEHSLNAWPSFQSMFYDGWILRFANGYTRRANSIHPLYGSSLDLDEKIRFCEDVFQYEGLATIYKITAASQPSDLDAALSARGYLKDAPTSVRVLDLDSIQSSIMREVRIQEDLTDGWLNTFCRINAVAETHRDDLRRILSGIVPPHCFGSLKSNGRVIACGMGVLQGGYLGLFDIVTDKDFRRRGFGRRVVEGILTWGRRNGARSAYLQVMLDNSPALHLYTKIGFIEKYQYWYRIKA